MLGSYAGDVTNETCWAELAQNPDSFLIDVRTGAEWNYVGYPLLPAGKGPLFQEWQVFPTMTVDPNFAETVAAKLQAAGATKDSKLFFLCRSGVRSQGAAAALTDAGFSHCYNILEGFEGGRDAEGHRGTSAGWKAKGLPWTQP